MKIYSTCGYRSETFDILNSPSAIFSSSLSTFSTETKLYDLSRNWLGIVRWIKKSDGETYNCEWHQVQWQLQSRQGWREQSGINKSYKKCYKNKGLPKWDKRAKLLNYNGACSFGSGRSQAGSSTVKKGSWRCIWNIPALAFVISIISDLWYECPSPITFSTTLSHSPGHV